MQAIQWFILGILFTLTVGGLTYLSFKVQLKWWAWATVICGLLLILFGFAWAGSSFTEGVPQSGAIAMIFFCGPGVLLNAWVWRSFIQQQLK
jgi:hypothetical protein